MYACSDSLAVAGWHDNILDGRLYVPSPGACCHCCWPNVQVSRQPDIIMGRMEGDGWLMEIDGEPVPKLLPYAVDIHLNWDLRCTFNDGDTYSWGTVRIVEAFYSGLFLCYPNLLPA